jgi:hypothetical protein
MVQKTSRAEFNPKDFELDGPEPPITTAAPETKPAKPHHWVKSPATRIKGLFTRGPIPARRQVIAGRQRGGNSAAMVGAALWQISGMRKSRTFTLSNVELRYWEIDADRKKCGLAYLEKAGLIRTRQVGQRSVEVTLLCTLGEEPERQK